jgi:hypothetical protein
MLTHHLKQPTEFWLDTYPVLDVLQTPELIQQLGAFQAKRPPCQKDTPIDPSVSSVRTSALFLQIRSAADFYTTNKTLMNNPPSVEVDISKFMYT